MDSSLISCALCLLVTIHVITSTRASLSTVPVTLSTSLGDVTGIRKSAGLGVSMVEVFYGIPYAKPPIGSRRFRPPLPAEPWGSAPLDGTVKPKACWQEIDTQFDRFPGVDMWNPNTERDEDCLYLNIWRPESSSTSYSGSGDGDETGSSHKTIMVWIFGGGFYSGSAVLDVYEASQLAVREDVIVINIAYRLGPMGFLYLGNANAPGNVGLMDQVVALQWIRENAINLGGSPDDITIFGESAGAASVGFHLFSPLSRNLFNNAIMQSTTPLADWAVMDTAQARSRSIDLSRHVLCLNDNDVENAEDIDENVLLDCLQNKSASAFSEHQWSIDGRKYFDITFGPIVDGFFLTGHPTELMRNGDVKITNVTVGVTKDEGIYFAVYGFPVFTDLNVTELTEPEFLEIMKTVADNNLTFRDELVHSYTEDEGGNRLDIVDATVGDTKFKCSVVNFAREYTNQGGQVHMYSFEENLSSNPWPDWMGVPHGYEIEAVFGIPVAPGSTNTPAEKDLSLQVMNLWATFAKTGSPSGNDNSTEWPLFTTDRQEYLVIDTNGLRIEEDMRHGMCQLWANRHEPSNVASTYPAQDEGTLASEESHNVDTVLGAGNSEMILSGDSGASGDRANHQGSYIVL